MITEKKIVKFDCALYCIFKIRDDWSGHDTVHLRKVNKVRDDYYTIKSPEGVKEVTTEVKYFQDQDAEFDKMRRWYHDTKF